MPMSVFVRMSCCPLPVAILGPSLPALSGPYHSMPPRGKAWSQRGLDILKAYIEEGQGPAQVQRAFPAWSYGGIKAKMRILKAALAAGADVPIGKGKGRPSPLHEHKEKSLSQVVKLLKEEKGATTSKTALSTFDRDHHSAMSFRRTFSCHDFSQSLASQPLSQDFSHLLSTQPAAESQLLTQVYDQDTTQVYDPDATQVYDMDATQVYDHFEV